MGAVISTVKPIANGTLEWRKPVCSGNNLQFGNFVANIQTSGY
jgi:hypothetical protein